MKKCGNYEIKIIAKTQIRGGVVHLKKFLIYKEEIRRVGDPKVN